MCIIEVDTKRKLPAGFDSVPRRAAIDAVESKKFSIRNCWSGWGTSKKRIDDIQQLWNKC